MRFDRRLGLAMLLCVASHAALACPRRLVTELAITDAHSNPKVETRLDGSPIQLYLDTGAEHTVVTTAAVARLGLATDWLGFQPLWGIGGLSVHFNALVRRLEFGAVTLRDQSVAVGDFGPRWLSRSQGLLGADILGRYDADIDLPHERVRLYEPVRCAAPMPGWKSAYGLVRMLDIGPIRHLALATLTLDGQPLVATVDTGAEWTAVTTKAAARLGVTEAALDADPDASMIGVGSNTRHFHIHRFARLNLGGAVWRTPRLMVGELPPFLGDMLLGADFLRTHRIWVSWINRVVFVAHDAREDGR